MACQKHKLTHINLGPELCPYCEIDRLRADLAKCREECQKFMEQPTVEVENPFKHSRRTIEGEEEHGSKNHDD